MHFSKLFFHVKETIMFLSHRVFELVCGLFV